MTALLLVAALAAFVALGVGVSLLRANPRPPLENIGVWFATLQGPRAFGAGLAAVGAVALILVLALRP